MTTMTAVDAAGPSATVADTWTRFWFAVAPVRPLAATRILTGLLGILLAWSYAADLLAWFGPDGMIPRDVAAAWRPRWGATLYDLASTPASVAGLFAATIVCFACLVVGLASRAAALAAAVLWASLLHRGPMLVGPADDCLAALLWCLVVGPCGADLSLDRLLARQAGRHRAEVSPWAGLALGLVRVLATAITVATLLAQLKGDSWWNGEAAWWLASRVGALDLRAAYVRSEYLMNFVTHAIVAFEILFAAGLWFTATRRTIARLAIVAWPLIGLLVGEPLWGLTMGVFAVPFADVV